MLKFLQGLASDRQFRLFACACCRAIHRFIPVGPCRDAVEVSLRYADGQATADELAVARTAAVASAAHAGPHSAAAWAACEAANPSAFGAARAAAHEAQEQIRKSSPRAAADEARAQAGFLRDIIGNPFCPVRPWALRGVARDPFVREITDAIYANPAREDMKLLATELERRGCLEEVILEHCRSSEPHVRGCWVIDMLREKEAVVPQPAKPVERVRPSWVQEVREALSRHLGPKKYRRFLRKAVSAAAGPGRVSCPEEWHGFIALHPEYEISAEQLTEVCAVCTVHGCELVEQVVSAPAESPMLLRDSAFLQARGTQFPHSYPEEGVGFVTEKLGWWCAECQRARAEWMRSRS
jgi:hypothetical protein